MATKRSRPKAGPQRVEHHTAKFTLDGGLSVKVRYLFDTKQYNRSRSTLGRHPRPALYDPKTPIYAILDRYPPGTSLDTVNRALAKVGASFVPWEDGSPGNYSTPRHPVYK
jgi:hypothetical protein